MYNFSLFYGIPVLLFNSIFIYWIDSLVSLSSLYFLKIHSRYSHCLWSHKALISIFFGIFEHIWITLLKSPSGILCKSLSLVAICVRTWALGGNFCPWLFLSPARSLWDLPTWNNFVKALCCAWAKAVFVFCLLSLLLHEAWLSSPLLLMIQFKKDLVLTHRGQGSWRWQFIWGQTHSLAT